MCTGPAKRSKGTDEAARLPSLVELQEKIRELKRLRQEQQQRQEQEQGQKQEQTGKSPPEQLQDTILSQANLHKEVLDGLWAHFVACHTGWRHATSTLHKTLEVIEPACSATGSSACSRQNRLLSAVQCRVLTTT